MSTKLIETLEQHMENPSDIIDRVNDLLYSLVARTVLGEFYHVYNEEKKGLQATSDSLELEAFVNAETELNKLKSLIDDLESVIRIDPDGLKESIRNRYMR